MAKKCDFCNKRIGFWDSNYELKDGIICGNCLRKNGFLANTKQRKMVDFLKTQTVADVNALINNPEKLEEIKYKVAPENHFISSKKCSFCQQEIGILDSSHKLKDGIVCDNCLTSKKLFEGINKNLMDNFLKTKTVAEIQDLINNPAKLSSTKESIVSAEKERIEKVQKEKRAKIEEENRLAAEREKFKKGAIRESHYYISVEQRKILIDKTLLSDPRYVNADEIVSYRINEKGHDEHKHHTIARAVTGGILAGGVGAIIGGTTGGKTNEFIDHLGIIINLIDGSYFEIPVLRSKTKSNSFVAKVAYSALENIISILDSWKAQKADTSKINDDVPAEIRKYKSLADEGIITSEEFETKKKQLLGL